MKRIILLVILFILPFITGTTFIIKNNEFSDKIIFRDLPQYVSYSNYEEQIEMLEDYENYEKLNIVIKGKTNFEYVLGEIDLNITAEEVDAIKKERLNVAREYYKAFNYKLYESLPQYDYESIYISKYFGTISVVVDRQKLQENEFKLLNDIANIDLVENVFVYNNSNSSDYYILNAVESVNLPEDIRTNTGDGAGVNVGLLDDGIVDTSLNYFSDANILCRDHWFYIENIGDHATSMAGIITGTYGMAPNCNLYSVEQFGSFTGELDWLLDQNVDVINMSFGYTSNPGTYDEKSALVDELIWNYGVTCCVAAGNYNSDNEGYVTNPALAYNALTVGAGTALNNIQNLDCYKVHTDVDKPTIISHSEIIAMAEVPPANGSSAATACTTGVVAGLMKCIPILKLYPAMVTALITATSYGEGFSFPLTSNLNPLYGAGFLDADKAHSTIMNCHYSTTNSSQGDMSFVFEYEEFFLQGEEIRISACWLAKSSGTVASLSMTDYDLCIFRPEGGQIDCTLSAYNNVEMLNLTIPATGTYTIRVIQSGELSHNSPTDICVAWTYEIQ